jgi:DNA-binding transcriptional regulator LsrR (DeoR family)
MGFGIDPPKFLGPIVKARTDATKPFSEGVHVAVVGIGALAGGHRLVQEMTSAELQPVEADLKKLRGLVASEAIHEPLVGDVCNHLFLIENSASGRMAIKKRKEVESVIERLNQRFLSTKPGTLQSICRNGAVLATAGGRFKYAAIRYVIERGGGRGMDPWISHLVTDKENAIRLLN